ncbi:hypothetical protein COOONC_24680, partial [Cooperia oncophora]
MIKGGMWRPEEDGYFDCTFRVSRSLSTVSNKYMHLTNYSINKLAEQDGVADSPVPKWRLTELWKYFEND